MKGEQSDVASCGWEESNRDIQGLAGTVVGLRAQMLSINVVMEQQFQGKLRSVSVMEQAKQDVARSRVCADET